MFNYPELVRLSIILCVSALIFGVSLRYKKVAFAKYSFYFGLVALFEILSLCNRYLSYDFKYKFFKPLEYITFIIILFFISQQKVPFPRRLFFYIATASFFSYTLFKLTFFPSLAYQLHDPSGAGYLLFLAIFIFIIIPIILIVITLETYKHKGIFTDSFSFLNFILTPLTVITFVILLKIEGDMTTVKIEKISSTTTLNGINLEKGNYYFYPKYKLNRYLRFNSDIGNAIKWHNMPVSSISKTEINYSGINNAVMNIGKIYEYLKVYVENDQLIHNRLCDKTEPLKFRFLSDNYNDWSEQNTEFVSCKLVADNPLNQMRILNNLGDKITLTYKPLQNDIDHSKKLYQDFNLLPYIKWHWKVNKEINIFPNIKSEITDLYLDDNRNLMALLIENEIENDNAENVILDNQCTLSRSEFRKMLILNVGSNPVTASFPKLSNEQKCTPQQLELYIDKKAIFDY